ncbi:MAG: thiamine-phosphate kinase [Thermodesulfovibrionia bacterium]|nr:thiamine-phosphate kinase [Thermodesulfovibrionia bacterium]
MTKKHVLNKKPLLSDLGEFGLIKTLQTQCIETSPEILKGIGDDAAAVKIRADKTLITTDMLLEGIHFDLSFTTFYQLGYKTLAVNISDIFAMGGKPKYFLLSIGIPKNYQSKNIHEFYSGIRKIAKKFGIAVVGGDTCASRHGLVISGTLIGEADNIIMRSGAREGDNIFVTDTLGDSAMGLMLLKKLKRKIPVEMNYPMVVPAKAGIQRKESGFRPDASGQGIANFKINNKQLPLCNVMPLLKRHLMPEPVPLEDTHGVTAMIDVSDGLLIDLTHICDESKVGAMVYIDKIPISGELAEAAKKLSMDPVKFALKGGEDYVLLFTAPPGIKTNAVEIGKIIGKGRFLVDIKGKKIPFKAEGYEHFKTVNSR